MIKRITFCKILTALQAATILVAMVSGKNFWQPKFWWKSGDGDHFAVKGCQKATFWKSELGALYDCNENWTMVLTKGSVVIAFDKGERLHSAVAFENFGAFIDTDLASPKNSSGAKLFRENDVIFIGRELNLVLRLSLLCLLNEVAMYFVSTKSFTFAWRPDVLPCSVWPALRVWCAFLSNSGLCFLVYFICSWSQSPRLRDVTSIRENSCIWLHLLI